VTQEQEVRRKTPGSVPLILTAVFWLLTSGFGHPFPQAPDLAAAVAGLQQRYAAVNTIRADFTQNYRAPGVDQTESGAMYMKKPGLMRWEYQNPEVKLFVADGRETYLYTPEDRQVMVQRFTAEDLRSTPLQFLFGQGDIRRSFDVSWEKDPSAGGAELQLRLKPRAAETEYGWLVIACDRNTFELRRLVVGERTGNTSEFVFRNMQTNVNVDPKQFEFKMPKGVQVVRLDKK
jgi:outer membrane lipoprotein carrier protein